MSPRIVPEGYKQITLILPDHTIEKLDQICKQEKRKRPGQIQHMIDKYMEGKE